MRTRSSRGGTALVVPLLVLGILVASSSLPLLDHPTEATPTPSSTGDRPTGAGAAGPTAPSSQRTPGPDSLGPAVLETLDLCNNTVSSGNWFPSCDAYSPEALTFDGRTGEVMVVDDNSAEMQIIAQATNEIVATVPIRGSPSPAGVFPQGAAFDPATGQVFAANYGSNNASVVSDSLDAVVATIPVMGAPDGVAYDNGSDVVLVTNSGSNTVSVIADATDQVVATIEVGGAPTGIAYDADNGVTFVANFGSDNVSVIPVAFGGVSTSLPVGTFPDAVVYDSGTEEIFVANSGSDTLSVYSATNYTYLGAIPVGNDPKGMAYDNATGEVFVAVGDEVEMISDTTDRVVGSLAVGGYPDGVVYDDQNGEIYVGNYGQGTISVIGSAFPLTFVPNGLPADATWSVNVSGVVASSTGSAIEFEEPNGTYTFRVGPVPGYAPSPTSGSVTVDGRNKTVMVTFAAWTYAVTFVETGLPSGTNWSGTIDQVGRSSTGPTLVFQEPNGSYQFFPGTVPGWTPLLVAQGFIVGGGPVSASIAWFPVGFILTFVETGLPAGATWSVEFGGYTRASDTSNDTFTATNGTYPFLVGPLNGYDATPSSGRITVNGTSLAQTITFDPIPVVAPSKQPTEGTFLGLSAVQEYLLLAAIVAVASGTVLVAYLWSRRGPPLSRSLRPPGE